MKGIIFSSINQIDRVETVDIVETTLRQNVTRKEFKHLPIESIEREKMPNLKPNEARLLEESINSDYKTANIRLKQGEYQYELAKAIASFELEQQFPNVKDLIKKLYGEEKVDDPQFTRKIQTILKKMEKNNVLKILPKNKPWELQRYALSSFKFIDIDKNPVVLATPQQIEQIKNLLNPTSNMQSIPTNKPRYLKIEILASTLTLGISYIVVLWSLLQPVIKPVVFIPAFSISIISSLALGKLYASKYSKSRGNFPTSTQT